MLTALVSSNSTPGALAATLSALVPAVAEGLVSHAVVMLPRPDPDSERIADAMGASLVTAQPGGRQERDWREAAQAARGDWVLLLEAGETPAYGWIGCIERHLLLQTAARSQAAILPLAGGWDGFVERLRLMVGRGQPSSGMLAPRRQIVEGKAGGSPVRLAVSRHKLQS